MKGIQSTLIACFSYLLLLGALAGAQPTRSDAATTLSISSVFQASTSITPTATVTPIYVPVSSVSSVSSISSEPLSTASSDSTSSSPSAPSAVSNTDGVAGLEKASPTAWIKYRSNRNLLIVLSTVLGSLVLALVIITIWLTRRYRRSQTPFTHRGASPIDDEEIASWRGAPSREYKQLDLPLPPPPVADSSVIGLAVSGWTWTMPPPSATKSTPSPSTIIPESPSSMARAPNSRAGLTDETKPGAVPYVPPPKRQSSRLSKAAPGHSRNRSRRSSASNKSMWSFTGGSISSPDLKLKEKTPTWYDPEDENIGKTLKDLDHNNDSPGTSIFDGLSVGGLSPRPASRPRLWGDDKEIGRARTNDR